MKFLFISIIFPVLIFASLNDELEKMSPRDAHLFQTKLSAKILEPLPESIFTRLSFGITGGVVFVNPKEFIGSVDPVHASDSNFKRMSHMDMSLLWKITENYLLGFSMSMIGKGSSEKITDEKYEDVIVGGVGLGLKTGYKFNLSNRFYLVPAISVGLAAAGAQFETTDDANEKTWKYRYAGAAPLLGGSMAAMYNLNNVFSIGMEAAYNHLKVKKLKRFDDDITDPKDIDLRGFGLGFKLAVNL